jgi:uncharacterized HhH-GPD family protein
VQKAFSGPMELKRRIGHLDPRRIAETEAAQLADVFRQRPALHRYPAAMAGRVQALCAYVVREYDGHAERVWTEARDGRDLQKRLNALPSFGDMKVRSMLGILSKRYAVQLPGLDEVAPKHPTLGDVDSPEALEAYQAAKEIGGGRAWALAGLPSATAHIRSRTGGRGAAPHHTDQRARVTSTLGKFSRGFGA